MVCKYRTSEELVVGERKLAGISKLVAFVWADYNRNYGTHQMSRKERCATASTLINTLSGVECMGVYAPDLFQSFCNYLVFSPTQQVRTFVFACKFVQFIQPRAKTNKRSTDKLTNKQTGLNLNAKPKCNNKACLA